MEFRIFKFRLRKDFQSLADLKKEFEKNLKKDKKKFLKKKAKIINEEEQKREKTKRETFFELIFPNHLEGICKYNFLSDNLLMLSFYTEKEDKKKGISPFYRRYPERRICNKCPPELSKKIFIWFKNPHEGILFINGGNPKATIFILEFKIPKVIPIEIITELKYANTKVVDIFNKLQQGRLVESINDMQVVVSIQRQNQPIYKTIIFKDVGSFEEYNKLIENYSNIKINKFSVNLNILDKNRKVKLIFRSLIDINPINTSLKSRAYEAYSKLFIWLGEILLNLSI